MANLGMMGMGVNMQSNSQYMYPQNRPVPKTYQNLFAEQLKVFKSSEGLSQKDIKSVFPLKRSCFHISISYKVYLDKLKSAGKSL